MQNRKGKTLLKVALIPNDKAKKFVLDLEKRPIRNEEGKIKTIHKMP